MLKHWASPRDFVESKPRINRDEVIHGCFSCRLCFFISDVLPPSLVPRLLSVVPFSRTIEMWFEDKFRASKLLASSTPQSMQSLWTVACLCHSAGWSWRLGRKSQLRKRLLTTIPSLNNFACSTFLQLSQPCSTLKSFIQHIKAAHSAHTCNSQHIGSSRPARRGMGACWKSPSVQWIPFERGNWSSRHCPSALCWLVSYPSRLSSSLFWTLMGCIL